MIKEKKDEKQNNIHESKKCENRQNGFCENLHS
jgi:hypothetical protein